MMVTPVSNIALRHLPGPRCIDSGRVLVPEQPLRSQLLAFLAHRRRHQRQVKIARNRSRLPVESNPAKCAPLLFAGLRYSFGRDAPPVENAQIVGAEMKSGCRAIG